jgi:pullulanase
MSKSSKINSLAKIISALLLCLGLAACSGGGTGGTGPDTNPGGGSGNGGGSENPPPIPTLSSLQIDSAATVLDLDEGPTATKLTLSATYSDNTTQDVSASPDTLWTAPNAAVASFNTFTFRLTAIAEGTATVKAEFGGKTATINILIKKAPVVEPKPQSLTLTTTSDALYEGDSRQILVSCLMDNNQPCDPMPTLTWRTSDDNLATVSNGLVHAKKAGAITVFANTTNPTLEGSLDLLIAKRPQSATLEHITIEPTNITITPGGTQALTVMGHYSDGKTKAIATPTWNSLNDNVVAIDTQGQAKALSGGYGYAFIEATAEGKNALAKISLDTKTANCANSTVKTVTFHYYRNAGDYDGWGLHLWGEAISASTNWPTPKLFDGKDGYGRTLTVALSNPSKPLNFVVHKAGTKDVDIDRTVPCGVSDVWLVQGGSAVNTTLPNTAFWQSRDTIKWDVGGTITLHHSDTAGLKMEGTTITGGKTIVLNSAGAGLYKLPANAIDPKELLKHQVWLSSSKGTFTGLQIQGVLDNVYNYTGELGVSMNGNTPTLRVWAPTAQSVALRVFDDSTITANQRIPMMLDATSGVWSVVGNAAWINKFYLYEVKVYVPLTGRIETNLVTDPYSVSLAMNSTRSQIVDLANDVTLKPLGWDDLARKTPTHPMDWVIYELHVREFSTFAGDKTVDNSIDSTLRGKYAAFSQTNFVGVKHLQRLAQAGLTHIHLLPTFDIATVNEDSNQQQSPSSSELNTMRGSAANSTVQREIARKYNAKDAWNWGYDPYHFAAPEGSYASNPNGSARIKEFREMVASLNKMGLGVIMDVVYNHTSSSGMWQQAVLDRLVPGYYHRLSAEGRVLTSSCCDDTASEQRMMEKLMIDTLVIWAKHYKVEGFRFDLMDMHSLASMTRTRDALRAVNPNIYIYGEGWPNHGSFHDKWNGKTENNPEKMPATQTNVRGTGIGAFSDLARNAISGGIHYNKDLGLITGDTTKYKPATNFLGGKSNNNDATPIDAPQEQIVYSSAHDDLTLWDTITYRLGPKAKASDLAARQRLGLDFILFAQGVPFLDSGVEMLRSKSGDANSYDSGDWFNRLDYTYASNGWGIGLPIKAIAPNDADQKPGDDKTAPVEWGKDFLINTELSPSSDDIKNTLNRTERNLRTRKAIRLLRLQTKREIDCMLTFESDGGNNGFPKDGSVIAMKVHDKSNNQDKCAGISDLDPQHEEVLVIFNTTAQEVSINYNWPAEWPNVSEFNPGIGDDGSQSVTCEKGKGCTFKVSAHYTGVFVQKQ